MSNPNDWLQNINPGDTVIVWHSGLGSRAEIRTVDKTTTTQITVGMYKYRRQDGRQMGTSRHSSYLEQSTPEALAEIQAKARRDFLLGKLRHETDWRDLPTEVLEAAWGAVEAAKK